MGSSPLVTSFIGHLFPAIRSRLKARMECLQNLLLSFLREIAKKPQGPWGQISIFNVLATLLSFFWSSRSIFNRFSEVVEYFDARLVGLTATPADFIDRDTFRLFGCDANVPTFLYDYPVALSPFAQSCMRAGVQTPAACMI